MFYGIRKKTFFKPLVSNKLFLNPLRKVISIFELFTFSNICFNISLFFTLFP